MRRLGLGPSLVVIALMVPSALMAAETLYNANALPLASGWQIAGSGPPNNYENGGGITSTIVSDAGKTCWKLVDASGSNVGALKNVVLGNISFDTGATIAASVRCSANSEDSSYTFGISNGGVGGLAFCIKADQCSLVQYDGTLRAGPVTFPSDTTGYHRYYLSAKNAVLGSNSSCKWTVYRDSEQIVTWSGSGQAMGGDGFFAGHGGQSGTGTWYFDWIALTVDGGFSPAEWDPVPSGPLVPPAPPKIIYPAQGMILAGTTTLLQWASDIHNKYEIRINTTDSPSGTSAWTSGEVASVADSCPSGQLSNGTYYVYARVSNLGGWSEWSAAGHTFSVNVQPPPLPGAPTVVIPEIDSSVVVRNPAIQWEGAAHDAFEVHINTSNSAEDGSVWDSGVLSSSADSCDTGILQNGAYYAFVRVRNAEGWGPWSPVGHRFQVNHQGSTYKQGWVLLRDDQAYNLDLLSKAREYHVNHVQISHDIIMYAHEPIHDIPRRDRINQLIDVAHQNGVEEVTVWTHEIQYRDLPSQYMVGGKVNLDDPGFWEWMDAEYELLFQILPNLDGLVFTFSENFGGGSDFNDRQETIHTGKSPTDSFEQAIRTLWNVCERHGKTLYIRTWVGAGPDRWARDAILRCDPRIRMMSKGVGAADWDAIQEYYDIIGTCTGHPELLELDVIGEYWGLGGTPCAAVDYIKSLWDFHRPNVEGMVARIDRGQAQAYSGPNRVNMYAIDALARSPETSEDAIYRYWSAHWFGQELADWISSCLKRTRDITSACNGLPRVYSFSNHVARDYVYRSLFDLDYVGVALKSANNFQPSGGTNYEVLHNPLLTAAGSVSFSPPYTLFGDFSPAYSEDTVVTCRAAAVDATMGLDPSKFKVEYSTDGGANWVNYTDFVWAATGSSVEPYRITVNSIPFGARAAGNNKVRFTATNNIDETQSKVFTVRGLDVAHMDLGSTIAADGITIYPAGDGNWTPTVEGGRQCVAPAGGGNVSFYFRADEAFAYDRNPSTVYLQVDYYGSGFLSPYYDSIWKADESLPPVYLDGGTTWRTATWELKDVNFGHRLNAQFDFNMYHGGSPVRIAAVRLLYQKPAGFMPPPARPVVSPISETQMEIRWPLVTGATKYQVCRNGGFVGWSTGMNLVDSGLSPNSQYTYTVTAFDALDRTSCTSPVGYATTLPPRPVVPSTVTCNIQPGVWQTSNSFQFTAVGGFGFGNASYYQYVWDESPAHVWSGDEPTWPSVSAPSGAPWMVWKPLASPTDNSDWLLCDGTSTMRTTSEELLTENGIPTWKYSDQGRIQNSKLNIVKYPNININRDVGATMVVRMKAADSPDGWTIGKNFGMNLADCPELGVAVTPDYVNLNGPSVSGPTQYVGNGYSYHTYVLTLKNTTPGNNNTATAILFRDGEYLMNITQGPTGWRSDFVGPWFGQLYSDHFGAWYYQWIAFRNDGAFPPSPNNGPLTVQASHPGSGFYMHLRSFSADGVPNGTLDLGPYYYRTGTTPVNPTVVDDGDYTTSEALHFTWSPVSASAESYEYAIGTGAGLQDVVPFANVGLTYEATKTGLSLTQGNTYYVTVRGIVGPNTYTGSSNGIAVAPNRQKIAEAKKLADNAPAALYGKTVTAVFPDCAYVQEENGMGIRVVTARPMVEGDVVDLAGRVSGSAAERCIAADSVFRKGNDPLDPLALSTAGIGGSGYGQPGTGQGQRSTKAFQWIVDETKKRIRSTTQLDVPGLNSLGLLVEAYGRVSLVAGQSFFLDDGSGFDEYFDTKRDGPAGVKVILPDGVLPPAPGTFLSVTGITSCHGYGNNLCRLLLVRHPSDLQTF